MLIVVPAEALDADLPDGDLRVLCEVGRFARWVTGEVIPASIHPEDAIRRLLAAGLIRWDDDRWAVRLQPSLHLAPPDETVPPMRHERKGRKRKDISVGKRYRILRRDSFLCVYCGRNASQIELVIDHRIAVANGGTNEDDNLCAACTECNSGKGTST